MKLRAPNPSKAILMIAYTHYKTDPRVIRQAEAAVDGGFSVDFISLRREFEPALEFINGVRVIRLNQKRYRGGGTFRYALSYLEFFLRCFLKTTWLQFRKRYKAVHVNNIPDFFVFCALFPKMVGAKVLLDIHDPMPNTFSSKFKKGEKGFVYKLLLYQERISAAFADQVLTVHEPVKQFVLVNQHGLSPESIKVIANFADDKVFLPQKPPLEDGKLRLVFHGTILERYGIRNALLAFKKLRYRDRIAVKIIGEGDFSGQLKRLIDSHHLNDIVEFDNRMYPMHQMPKLLEGFNLGLVPLEISSITEYALPLKLLEYLALGMPSVTVRNTAIRYYFGDDDCFFYDPNVPDSLCNVIDQIIEEPEVLGRCRQRVLLLRERYLWSSEKAKYIEMLQQMTNAKGYTGSPLRIV